MNNKFGNMNIAGSPRGIEGNTISHENTAHLKGKLSNLYETIIQLEKELGSHKKEVQILRSEKETLESVLTMKS